MSTDYHTIKSLCFLCFVSVAESGLECDQQLFCFQEEEWEVSCQVLEGTLTSKRNEQNKEVVEAESFSLMLDFVLF